MRLRALQAALGVGLLTLLLVQAPAGSSVRTARAAFDYSKLSNIQKRILSGAADLELNPASQAALKTAAATAPRKFDAVNGNEDSSGICSKQLGSNVKVNQNCLNLADTDLNGRGQAQNETAIASDTMHPNHLLASYNDYRRGDGTCGVSFSLDGGRSWTDATTPNGFTRGTNFGGFARQYWQGGGDTSVAFDTKGNGYLSCQLFNRGPGVSNNPDFSSSFYVYRATGNPGASWNFPGRPVTERLSTTFVPLLDKQYLTVDNHVGSPFQDRVYVTWTDFAADGTAYIFEASSNDYAETFSTPVLVSGNNGTLCNQTFGLPTPRATATRTSSRSRSRPRTGPST